MNTTIFSQRPHKEEKDYREEVHAYHHARVQNGKTINPLRRKMLTVGAIGWTIAVPTVLGAALGLWVDTLWPNNYSWFSMLLPVGFLVGCLAALFWSWQETP